MDVTEKPRMTKTASCSFSLQSTIEILERNPDRRIYRRWKEHVGVGLGSNVRELEGSLTRLGAFAISHQEPASGEG
jgi:hypothetical protein